MRGERYRTVMLSCAHGYYVGAATFDPVSENTRKWCIEGTRLCRRQDVRSPAEKVSGCRRDTPALLSRHRVAPQKLSSHNDFSSLFDDSGLGASRVSNQAILGSKGAQGFQGC